MSTVRRAFLFTLRADGSPTCHPMAAAPGAGGAVFNMYAKSVKARNLLRDPRAAALLLADWSAPAGSARRLAGRALPTEAAEDVRAFERPAPAAGLQVPEGMAERVSGRREQGKRMLFRLHDGRGD
ncbi:MAG: pyridoxamine 5'-phosphate oxidase family protein [Gammaproteobacteria bacterium]